MHMLKHSCILAALWHTGSAVALPYHARTDEDYSQAITPKLFDKNTPEWPPILRSRGDAHREPAIRRHSLAYSASQYSSTKRDRKGEPILQPLIPTPGSAIPLRKGLLSSQKAGEKGTIDDNHDQDSAGGTGRIQSAFPGFTVPASNRLASFRNNRHTARSAGYGKVDPYYYDSSQSQSMLPPPPRPPQHITLGLPTNSIPLHSQQPVYGYPVVPSYGLSHQHAPGSYKEPGADLEPYLTRRSVNYDLNDFVLLTSRGSSFSSPNIHGSSRGHRTEGGSMIRGADGPDRAARTTLASPHIFSRPCNDVLSLAIPQAVGRPQSPVQELGQPPPSPSAQPASPTADIPQNGHRSRSSSPPAANIPQNGHRSRSSSPAEPSRVMKRSAILPRTPGMPSKQEHRSSQVISPARNDAPPARLSNGPPAAWSRIISHVVQHTNPFSMAPDPVAEAALRDAAHRAVEARNSPQALSHPLPNGRLIERPGTPFNLPSQVTSALRSSGIANNYNADPPKRNP